MRAHKIGWYKEWSDWRFSHHFHTLMLVMYVASILLGSLGLFWPSENTLAASKNWPFNEGVPSDYYSYGAKVTVGGGMAALGSHTPSTDWIATDVNNWMDRRAITISNPNGSSAYQVQITGLDTQQGGKMHYSGTDCKDLRFTSSDGVTVIPHWVESASCNSASTTVWVKVPQSIATIYMYYNNSNGALTSTSSDTAVFERVIGNVQGAWPMNETSSPSDSADYSGNGSGYDINRWNDSHFYPDANGKFGYSRTNFSLQTVPVLGSSAPKILDASAPKLNITNNLSISAWIYTTAGSTFQVIADKGDNGAGGNSYRFRINNDGRLRLSWQHGDSVWHSYGANTVLSLNTWHHVAVTYSSPNGTFYLDGSQDGTFSDANTPTTNTSDIWIGNSKNWNNPFQGYIDELKIYDTAVLSQTDITALADPGIGNHYSYFSPTLHPNVEYIREYTANVSAGAAGNEETYYYNDYPTIQNQETGNGVSESYISAMSIATGGTGSVRFQITPDNGTTWYRWNGSAWATVASPDSYDPNKTNTPAEVTTNIAEFRPGGANPRNFRWRAFFVSDGTQTATITNVSITYQVDITAPSNPVIGGVTAYESDGGAVWVYDPAQLWHNYSAPKFTWSVPSDTGNPDASGVWRYYAKQDTDSGYTPTSGDATTNPSLIMGSMSNGQTYYLRIRTEDNAENVSSAATLLTYKYDSVAPSDPTNIQANTLQPTDQPLSFSWDASTDPDPDGAGPLEASTFDHYEYKVGAISGWVDNGASTSVSGITGDEDGNNTFRVRAVDKAGNISGEDTIVYNYILNAPSEPLNLTVTDQSKTVNNFEFTWEAPSYVKPGNSIAGYKFFVNELPSASPNNSYSYIGAGENDLGNILTKSGIRAFQQGNNRFYIVAYDNEGRVNYANYAWKDFQVDTTATALTAPQTVVISDVSDRHKPDHYALALSWKAPANYDAGTFGHYNIRRTTSTGLNDAQWLALTPVGTASSPAFAEANLTKDQMYYYRVSGVDNAGAELYLSEMVQKAPTGKYIEPPTDSLPVVSVTATTATVTWTTDRESYSKVEYGKTGSYGMQNSSLQTTNTHSVTLYGLDPGTVYHYRTQSLDPADQKDYDNSLAYSSDYTFQTQPAPGISDVKISDIRLNSAIITWKTTSSATSTLRYGKSNAYGKELSDSSGSAVTTHTVKLSDLDHSSTYHFKIYGTDTDGNTMQSDDYNFDTLTFPRVSNVGLEQLKETATATMKFTWESNVPISSVLHYTDPTGKTLEASESDLKTSHELIISGLKDNTDYTLVVNGRDAYGNEASSGSERFKTDFDTRPPKISEITTETSISGYGSGAKAQLVVSWYTDEPSTSQVQYSKGVTGDTYSMSTQEDGMLTTSHVVVVSDLDPSSSYYFRVVSKDNSGNEGRSDANSALTEEARSSIFDLVLKSFEATLGWLFGG